MKNNQKTAAVAATTTAIATIPTTVKSIAPFTGIMMNLDLTKIDPNPFNPRTEVDDTYLSELARSIGRNNVQTPIKVRPLTDGRYQIVYGECRWRASMLAGKTTIPANVESMTNEQAEICAIVENMQRKNFSPFEEAQIFRRLLEERGKTITQICEDLSVKEAYVKRRLNLTNLIDEVATMLRDKDITLEVAFEFAKYDAQIQKEVYEQHFCNEGWSSWRGIRAKDFAKRLYESYMTKLDNYHFDKTECDTCNHNTLNQVLFKDCGGECAGCQNATCLKEKNTAYLTEKCIALLSEDPHIHIAVTSNSNKDAASRLVEAGYLPVELDKPLWRYDQSPEKPEPVDPDDYDDDDDLAFAMENYQEELAEYEQSVSKLKTDIATGRTLKYAVIDTTDIAICYEELKCKEVDEHGVSRISVPESPANNLIEKDSRNKEICYEHITTELKKVVSVHDKEFPTGELTEREEQFFYYALLKDAGHHHKQLLGLKSYVDDDELMNFSAKLTAEQKTMIKRMTIMRYCNKLSESRVREQSADTVLLTEFTTMHWPDRSTPVQERYKNRYDKLHANLQVRIKALEQEHELLTLRAEAEASKALPQAMQTTQDGITFDIQTGEIIETVGYVDVSDAYNTTAEQTETIEFVTDYEQVDYPEPDIDDQSQESVPWYDQPQKEQDELSEDTAEAKHIIPLHAVQSEPRIETAA